MSPKEQWLLVGLVAAIGLGAASLYVHHQRASSQEGAIAIRTGEEQKAPIPAKADNIQPGTPNTPNLPQEPVNIAVSIRGAVVLPNVYELPESARVQDLVLAAGGLQDNADMGNINLAARLIDGSTLFIPAKPTARKDGNALVIRRPDEANVVNPSQYTISGWQERDDTPAQDSPEAAAAAADTAPGLLDLNRASAQELESLHNIGPKLSQAIIDHRAHNPFRSVEDVTRVSGIGPKTLESIRPMVTVRPPPQ